VVDQKTSRLPSLDGWRAMRIIMVLGAHSKFTLDFPPEWYAPFKLIFNGNLGVRTFFVISGFRITWLLLKERENCGRIRLRRF